MKNKSIAIGVTLALLVPALPLTPVSLAIPETASFALAGRTVFTSAGSMAGRIVVDHNMTPDNWTLDTGAANAIIRIDGRNFALLWEKNREVNHDIDEDFGFPTLVPGVYFIYMASTPPMPMTLTIHFPNETGNVASALDIPIQSWMGELQPTTIPADGTGRVISKWTSVQPFSGNAFSIVYRHDQFKPEFYSYHEEYRWSLPDGVYNCFDYVGLPGPIGIGPNWLDEEGGDTFGAIDYMSHNGTATFDMWRYSIGVPTTWLSVIYWIQRLPDDIPWDGAPSDLDWAQPVSMPAGLGNGLDYDVLCATRNVPLDINDSQHLANDYIGLVRGVLP